MFASTKWMWNTTARVTGKNLHKQSHLINPDGNVISTQIPQLLPVQGWKPRTQNSARQMQNLEENIFKKKARTCTRSTKQSTAKPQERQGMWSSPALPAPPDRNNKPPDHSFIPYSAVTHLNSLPGDVFLIFLLNNWNTQINILEDEYWHKYYSTRMTSKNPSCTFLWCCCFSVWHLMLPNWIIDWKSIFRINGHIHWFSPAPPGVFTALLKSRFTQSLISLLGDKHKCQIVLQKGLRVRLHPIFFF